MAIKQLRKVKAGTLHFSNLDKRPKDLSILDHEDTTVTNAMEPAGLIDPETYESGDLHFSNLDKVNKNLTKSKTVKAGARKITAGDIADEIPSGTDGSNNISTIDNDVDPVQDYLDTDEADTLLENAQGDTELGASNGNVDTLGDGEENIFDPTMLEADTDGDTDWDEEDGDDDLPTPPEEEALDVAIQDSSADDQLGLSGEVEEDFDNAMPIGEIRQVDDTIQNVAFVMQAGSKTLCVVKDTTVIASMSPARAKKAQVSDVYASAAYHHLLTQEAKKHGLMSALVANGFATERLNLSASKVVAKTIKLEAASIERRLTKVQAAKQEALDQSIAIAAVGISRNFFNQVDNPLRAALEQELVQAGMKNPQRMLQRIFASHGQGYIQNALALAHKLSAMNEQVRADYAEALDLVNEAPEEAVELVSRRRVQANEFGGDAEEDDGYEFEGDESEQSPVTANLTAALLRRPSKVTAAQVGNKAAPTNLSASSVTDAVLRGDTPLFTYGLNI